MKTVFVLQHSYQLDDDVSSEETKFIGVYSSRLKAEQAVKRLGKQPGFKRLPKYFCVDEYAVDQDNWAEGFITDRFTPVFSVWRKDRVGKIHLVRQGLVEADALRLVRELKRKDKRQNVWAKEHA